MSIEPLNRWVLDRPNSYIGRSVPRPNAKRLLEGRGNFVDDIVLPRMLHVVFVRSPYAHARIDDWVAAEAWIMQRLAQGPAPKDIVTTGAMS